MTSEPFYGSREPVFKFNCGLPVNSRPRLVGTHFLASKIAGPFRCKLDVNLITEDLPDPLSYFKDCHTAIAFQIVGFIRRSVLHSKQVRLSKIRHIEELPELIALPRDRQRHSGQRLLKEHRDQQLLTHPGSIGNSCLL